MQLGHLFIGFTNEMSNHILGKSAQDDRATWMVSEVLINKTIVGIQQPIKKCMYFFHYASAWTRVWINEPICNSPALYWQSRLICAYYVLGVNNSKSRPLVILMVVDGWGFVRFTVFTSAILEYRALNLDSLVEVKRNGYLALFLSYLPNFITRQSVIYRQMQRLCLTFVIVS